jgi:TRAP transporter 4TM/12TM fusion protein
MRYLNRKELGINNNLELIVFIICAVYCLVLQWVNLWSNLQPWANRALILMAALVVIFLSYPFSKKNPVLRWTVDGFLIALTIWSYGYMVLTAETITLRLGMPDLHDQLVYLPGVVVCLEATRRSTSPSLAIVGLIFVLYAHFGHWVPGFFSHREFDYGRVAEGVFLGIDGLFSTTTHVMLSMVWYFIIFGAFLSVTGAGKTFMDFAFALTGTRQGGPAQSAVLSSMMFGSVSGSGVANVATTGTFTIPFMKRVGYKPHFAGAVETAASMGGQITPPVMGSAAFLISGITGIAYIAICKAAVIPTLLYFLCLLLAVFFEAGRMGLHGLPRDQVPRLTEGGLLARAAIPLSSIVVIILILLAGRTPRLAAAGAVIWLVFLGFIRKEMDMNPAVILRGLAQGFKAGAPIATVLAISGACVGIITITGIGMKFSTLVVNIGQSHLVFAVASVMLATIFLGMGLPTPAAYMIMAIVAGPGLAKLGIPNLMAHLIIFYFAVFAGETPPVGVAFITAAGIAKAPAMKTGITSFRIALVGLAMPYLWVFKPGLILQAPWQDCIWTIITTSIGVIALSMANIGFWKRKMNFVLRLLQIVSALILMFASFYIQLMLLPIVLFLMLYNKYGFSILTGKPKEFDFAAES